MFWQAINWENLLRFYFLVLSRINLSSTVHEFFCEFSYIGKLKALEISKPKPAPTMLQYLWFLPTNHVHIFILELLLLLLSDNLYMECGIYDINYCWWDYGWGGFCWWGLLVLEEEEEEWEASWVAAFGGC